MILALLINLGTASASSYVYNVQCSSYPNPSIEGQEVTFTSTVTLKEYDTGEIYPANGGFAGLDNLPLGGSLQQVSDGTVLKKISYLSPGSYTFETIYFWPNVDIYDHFGYVTHDVIPYVKSCQVSSSPNPAIVGEPVTIKAKFDLEETDDPNFIPPNVAVYATDISSDMYLGDYRLEGNTVIWTIPSLDAGTHEIHVAYDTMIGSVPNDYESGSRGEYRYTLRVIEESEIPEFPSIVLPVISVVGLLLLIGRKKNN